MEKTQGTKKKSTLESYFRQFRENIIGINQTFQTPYGEKKILYADWIASGRLYRPIEEKLLTDFGPFVANTHTETTITGTTMTRAYAEARRIIKDHANASGEDVLITTGSGMTGVINKFQRILGLKVLENLKPHTKIPDLKRPVVFLTHMEHHSNQTTWLETIARVVVVPPGEDGLICLDEFEKCIRDHQEAPIKIAAVTAASNVTGIRTPYHEIARLIHRYNGLCFVDFACSAPYVDIDMHPEDNEARLDAIYFSPHKFLGGPGSSGVLLFHNNLYHNQVPDNPGGGTVSWTNPWGNHKYIDDIETREDGGTPAFLQTIRVALAIKLKEEMGVRQILEREHELINRVFDRLGEQQGINILAPQHRDRLGCFSFYIDDLHFNLAVKLLNDRYGIQTRGGCSCAGTYGHYLLHVDEEMSRNITCEIDEGDLSHKPGWIRMSIHPTNTWEEIEFICDSIMEVAENHKVWAKDYRYDPKSNEFIHRSQAIEEGGEIRSLFTLS
ncbi:aminotransferase class V-fold PLP-dependent enzyme [Lentiprolixibacter aurantiacus]|uniref:Aminotransferase class V-fold PLP-dependent enzyme n=1 Tax=Lentiprolixibacter aurantiacus TaxID=2993939 RepID=A0AAE3MPI3_9FLAO|nr:aminotransferase class V-fold PLP-dependent enzyme [Lentiprolixibacter aurantiacus]MCX2720607.1 aminotransferase class V-fold PLP-dependent enzyme [Lentiprolixibacter aurantiacus]